MNDGINNPPPKAIEMGTTASDFQNLHELVAKARANLNQNAWDYLVGGTETETTLQRNRMALDDIAFRPRVLRDVSNVDASVKCGPQAAPAGAAGAGRLAGNLRSGRGGAVVRGAAEFGAAHMLSSVSEPGLESPPRRPRRARIFQLYVRGDDAFVDDRSSAPSTTAMTRSASRSTPRITAGANATSPSAVRAAGARQRPRIPVALDWRDIERIKARTISRW